MWASSSACPTSASVRSSPASKGRPRRDPGDDDPTQFGHCNDAWYNNHANEGGGAVFFVSNHRSGTPIIRDSELRRNPSNGFETAGYPGIFVLASGPPIVENSIID